MLFSVYIVVKGCELTSALYVVLFVSTGHVWQIF